MDAGPTLKHKVTVKLSYKPSTTFRPPSDANPHSRPPSPVKQGIYTSPNDSNAPFRPKAKINSTATTRRPAVNANLGHGSTGATPRSDSPMKTITRVRSTLSPKNASSGASSVSVSRTARVPPAASAPVTPESRRVLPPSAALTTSREGPTYHYTSLHPTSSTVSSSIASNSSTHPRLTSSKSVVNLGSDRRQAGSPTLRVRSKVSQVTRIAAESAPPTPPLPYSNNNLYPSSRIITPRPRAPSSSSSYVSQQPTSPPTQFYPITTAVSAANPHRFPSARPAPAARSNPSSFQAFGSPSNIGVSVASQAPASRPVRIINGGAKIDPASIPLPLNSPPASTVSFSSRSSASASYLGTGEAYTESSRGGSVSTDTGSRLSPNVNAPSDMRAALDNLMNYTSEMQSEDEDTTSGVEDVGETRTEVKAAKSNRKIADLEITNRSLMAINTSLEATKHRQAKEIRELRRKLRETRLILPPRTYEAIKSSDGLADEEVSEEEDEEDASDLDDNHGDETYKRVRIIMENLLKSGEEALRTPASVDADVLRNTTKVLTPAELNEYHNDGEPEDQDGNLSVDDTVRTKLYSDDQYEGGSDSNITYDHDNFVVTLDDSDDEDDSGNITITSEDEVEAMMHDSGHRASTGTPPILITEPSS